MNLNRKIKIIKNARRQDDKPEAAEGSAERGRSAPDDKRAVAGRVGAWVREFQQRQIVDPRRAFARVFVAPGT